MTTTATNIHTVLTDNFGGGAAAVDHLVAADIGGSASSATARTCTPPPSDCADSKRPSRDTACRCTPSSCATRSRARPMLYETTRELPLGAEPPTAISTSQNLITIDAVRTIHSLGMQRAVAIVGFDDGVLGDVVQPGLTVLAQDPAGLGRAAAELLFSRVDGFDGPTQHVVLAPTLIARGSGELPVAAVAA